MESQGRAASHQDVREKLASLAISSIVMAASLGVAAPGAASVGPTNGGSVTYSTPGFYKCAVDDTVGGVATLSFTVKGGLGGSGFYGRNAGGRGARLSGTFQISDDSEVYLTVGDNGLDAVVFGGSDSAGGGGGGYSAISLLLDDSPIVVAGGGGGGSFFWLAANAPDPAFFNGNLGGASDPNSAGGAGAGGVIGAVGGDGGTTAIPGVGGGSSGGAGGAPRADGSASAGDSGGGGGGGFGATGGLGSSNYSGDDWAPLPGAYGGGGGGGYDGGGGGGGWAGGGGGEGGRGTAGAGGGGGGSSLLVTDSTAPGISNPSLDDSAADSNSASVAISGVSCQVAVTYKSNGGTGTAPTNSNWYSSGDSFFAARGTGLTKGSNVFIGWSTEQFGEVDYRPGDAVIVGSPAAAITLWAVYGSPTVAEICNPGGSGSGSLTDPFVVSNPMQLAAIDDSTICMTKAYVQVADISLSDDTPWLPLGSDPSNPTSRTTRFTGVYYGGCRVIDGITVGSADDTFGGNGGLFNTSEGATFTRMRLTNVNVNSEGSSGSAGLAGYMRALSGVRTLVREVEVSGAVANGDNYYAGLIAGDAEGARLERIFVSGSVTTGTRGISGGVAGYGALVSEAVSSAVVSSDDRAGGLVGALQPGGVLTDVMATGSVAATGGQTSGAGGLVGSAIALSPVQIVTSYATGSVTPSINGKAGGLVGRVAENGAVTYSNAFWDSTSTGQGTTADDSLSTTTTGAKTTAQMKSPATFASWDRTVWKIANGAYPTLQWVEAGGVAATCPQVTSVAPSTALEGTAVTITGSGFTGATNVTFDDTPAIDVVIVNDTTMTAKVPAGTGSVAVSFTPAPLSVVIRGADDSLTLPVATKASAFTYGNPPGPTPDPVFPPSAPVSVRASAGNTTATVSWSAPAQTGSFPVSTYKATSQPGGRTCLVAAPALTCVVTGLTNGVTYTFTVEALNGAGWSPPGGPSNPVTPSGTPTPTPVLDPVPVPPLPPGNSYLTVNGTPQPVEVDPNAQSNGVDITGDDFAMNLQGLDGKGQPLQLGPDGVLILNVDRQVQTTGTGFQSVSEVDLYLDPPTLVTGSARAAAADLGTYLGTVITNGAGDFAGTATLPEGIEPGDHVIQAVGLSKAGAVRAVSLGVRVLPSLELNQGTRKPDGRHDRIRTTGTSTGIPAGTKLTPYIRYSGQSGFSKGKATITVQADGSFRWTRQIRKDKAVTGYVAWTSIDSNQVTWVKVR